MKTNYFFTQGKISFVMDGGAGSSGKSLISSFLVENASNVNFLLSSFTPNASHTVCEDDGSEFVYKIFAGGSQHHHKLSAVYIVDNSAIELHTLFKEMEHLGIPRNKVRISPRCAIVQKIDADFEAGLCDLNGVYLEAGSEHDGTVATGSTCSGSGTVLAKKAVRNKTLVVAKDVPELQDMLYPMDEIINRLEAGEAGLYEIAQGFPLSVNHHRFAPHTTSRNVTVTGALNDAFIPALFAGNVMINWRTFPIKIHSKKYKCTETGNFLTWDEVVSRDASKYTVVESYSGNFYPDQEEISWDEITRLSGSKEKVMEVTTLTKLPRRVATFSEQNLVEAIRYNRTAGTTYLCFNFFNYVDSSLSNIRGSFNKLSFEQQQTIKSWFDKNLNPLRTDRPLSRTFIHERISLDHEVYIKYIGTGKKVNDRITID